MTLGDFVKQHEWQSFKLTVTLPHPAGPRPWEVEFVVFSFNKVKKRERDGANLFTYFVGSKGEAAEKVEAGEWVPFAAGGMAATAVKYDNGFQEDSNLGLLAVDKRGRGLVYLPRRGAAPPQALTVTLDALFALPAKKRTKHQAPGSADCLASLRSERVEGVSERVDALTQGLRRASSRGAAASCSARRATPFSRPRASRTRAWINSWRPRTRWWTACWRAERRVSRGRPRRSGPPGVDGA